MEKHFCMACGKEFEAANSMIRFCPECAAAKKAQQREKQKEYAKARQANLGLTNISIYKTDKEYLLGLAQDKKVAMAEVIKEIVDNLRKQAAETEIKTEETRTKAPKIVEEIVDVLQKQAAEKADTKAEKTSTKAEKAEAKTSTKKAAAKSKTTKKVN